jgi:hypothetical protein
MTRLMLAALALLVLAVVAFLFSAPMLAIPLFVLALLAGAFGILAQRASAANKLEQELHDAQAQKTHFTERDRETLA